MNRGLPLCCAVALFASLGYSCSSSSDDVRVPDSSAPDSQPPVEAGWEETDTQTDAGEPDSPGDHADSEEPSGDAKQPSCTEQEQYDRWLAMDKAPILPLIGAADLDLRPHDGGLTLAQAETINCDAVPLGDFLGDGSQAAAWGAYQEVMAIYDPLTTIIQVLYLSPGYTGAISFHRGSEEYQITAGEIPKKNGQDFIIDWNDPTKLADEVDELYRALVETFAPTLPIDPPGTSCLNSTPAKCKFEKYGDVGALGFVPLKLLLMALNVNAAQPDASGIVRVQVYAPNP